MLPMPPITGDPVIDATLYLGEGDRTQGREAVRRLECVEYVDGSIQCDPMTPSAGSATSVEAVSPASPSDEIGLAALLLLGFLVLMVVRAHIVNRQAARKARCSAPHCTKKRHPDSDLCVRHRVDAIIALHANKSPE